MAVLIRRNELAEALEAKGTTVTELRMKGMTPQEARLALMGCLEVNDRMAECLQDATGIPASVFVAIERRFCARCKR